ncbi:putative 2OG-Fe(II) oxygenase family oxidoreductase [Aspergillus clavatus NRRL 1]|uniref:2OG-Fe(II) oxygenase family oxidoreductase, putative n=1 Tax=Aspergillus clavatus (strain ATCC 1007 / CBS 513.65 / DSM 816 / NCTC 3887 / NRRL 1 / QM 1276 / 107) TaxID=344612 RepID=A1CCV5_ASPCL|nr:2OG-Fe(II) oxygenase family oxidoreductase, putative [Aspergillus clavatus NRRL 1]EAW12362.1 2OG-Fe(II) oxygenase family oxidoreductase, putative [Aspergillus clavatus NRRL 1]
MSTERTKGDAPTEPKTKSIRWGVAAALISLLSIAAVKLDPELFKSSLETIQFPLTSISEVFSKMQNESRTFEAMYKQYSIQCPAQKYQTHIFTTDPLIVYIEDYLSHDETVYLQHLAESRFMESPVSKGYRLDEYDTSIRSSQSAVLPRDPVVACIEQRTMDFQGFQSLNRLEDLQVVKYGINDQFRPHFDWFGGMENPRVSTIFAYLECDGCVGGSTQFPHYRGSFPAHWCRFIDCEDNEDNRQAGGVGFKVLRGNAVFWRNLYENGTGHPGVWHAGMPVRQGKKYGLNIFTRRDNIFEESNNAQESS